MLNATETATIASRRRRSRRPATSRSPSAPSWPAAGWPATPFFPADDVAGQLEVQAASLRAANITLRVDASMKKFGQFELDELRLAQFLDGLSPGMAEGTLVTFVDGGADPDSITREADDGSWIDDGFVPNSDDPGDQHDVEQRLLQGHRGDGDDADARRRRRADRRGGRQRGRHRGRDRARRRSGADARRRRSSSAPTGDWVADGFRQGPDGAHRGHAGHQRRRRGRQRRRVRPHGRHGHDADARRRPVPASSTRRTSPASGSGPRATRRSCRSPSSTKRWPCSPKRSSSSSRTTARRATRSCGPPGRGSTTGSPPGSSPSSTGRRSTAAATSSRRSRRRP